MRQSSAASSFRASSLRHAETQLVTPEHVTIAVKDRSVKAIAIATIASHSVKHRNFLNF